MDFFFKERGGGNAPNFLFAGIVSLLVEDIRKVCSYNITAAIINTQYNDIQREYPHYIRVYTVNRTPPFSL